MIFEALEPLAILMNGDLRRLAPGERVELPQEYGAKLLDRAGGKVRLIETASEPLPPVPPGWHVAYRVNGQLRGGFPDPAGQVVETAYCPETGWRLILADQTVLPLDRVVSVGKIRNGRLVAAWVVGAHGYDGERFAMETLP